MKKRKRCETIVQDKITTSYETGAAQDNVPVTPLPNPGEGGPVYPGNTNGNMQDNMDNVPVIPLPNPGEGGPVYPGNMNNTGSNNMNSMLPNIIGTIISSHPRPNEPCRLCNPSNSRRGWIRFLNAATGYNPFVIFVNENMVSNSLNFAEVTDYERVSDGRQVITVMGENGYIYVQKAVDVTVNAYATIAVINTDSGLDIQMIADSGCDRGSNMSCIRAANLAHNSGALSVVIGNQYVNFPNLRYRTVADFESIWPGLYIYTVSRSMTARYPGFGGNVLLTATLAVQQNRNYTIYLLNWKRDSGDTLQALIVEDM